MWIDRDDGSGEAALLQRFDDPMPDTGWLTGGADHGDMTGIEKQLQRRSCRKVVIVKCRHDECRVRVTPC